MAIRTRGDTANISWTVEGVRERYHDLEERASADGDSPMTVLASEPFCVLEGTTQGAEWTLTVYLTGSFLRAVRKSLKGQRQRL